MNAENRYALQRFALKAALLSVFALVQWRHGYILTLGTMFAIAAVIDMGVALHGRVPLQSGQLSYWDEAAALILMSALAGVFGRTGT